jgi:hypothetical protein
MISLDVIQLSRKPRDSTENACIRHDMRISCFCTIFVGNIFSLRQTLSELRLRCTHKRAKVFVSSFFWNMSIRLSNPPPPPITKSHVNPKDSQLVTCGRTEIMKDMRLLQRWFWDIMPCSPLKVNRRFAGTCRLHLQGRRISEARKQCER